VQHGGKNAKLENNNKYLFLTLGINTTLDIKNIIIIIITGTPTEV